MDVREKLIELLTGYSIDTKTDVEYVVDHLIAHGTTIQKWISVKDRLPKKNREAVLIALCWEETDIGWYDKDDKCWQSEFVNSYDDGDVTHWMLLPQAPKGE